MSILDGSFYVVFLLFASKFKFDFKNNLLHIVLTDLKVLKSQVDGINQHMPIIDDKVFNMRFFKEVAIGLLLLRPRI